MKPNKPNPPDHIRALLEEADRVCAEADVATRRIRQALDRPAFWPDRRHPRRWNEQDYGCEAGTGNRRHHTD